MSDKSEPIPFNPDYEHFMGRDTLDRDRDSSDGWVVLFFVVVAIATFVYFTFFRYNSKNPYTIENSALDHPYEAQY